MTRSEFEHIAPQLRQRVLEVCLGFFGSRQDAEDAAQETMVQLWRNCEHIDTERNVEALAVRVAKNCCISLYRKQHQSVDIDMQLLQQLEADDSPQAQLEAEDMQRMLAEAMSQLKPRERQLFEMRHTDDLTTEEIAAQTGIPKTSVAAMVSAARRKVIIALRIILSTAAVYLVGLYLWLQQEPKEKPKTAHIYKKVEKKEPAPQPPYCTEGTPLEQLTCYLERRKAKPTIYQRIKQMRDENEDE